MHRYGAPVRLGSTGLSSTEDNDVQDDLAMDGNTNARQLPSPAQADCANAAPQAVGHASGNASMDAPQCARSLSRTFAAVEPPTVQVKL